MAAKPATQTIDYNRAVAIAKARGWRPETQDTRTGDLVAVRLQHSDYPKPAGSDYPVLVFENVNRADMTPDGTFFSLHAFHEQTQEWLTENKPAIGARMTMTHLEKVERTDDEKAAGKNDYHDWYFVMGDGTQVETVQSVLPWA